MGPAGDLIVEQGEVREKTRYRWDELQFVSLLSSNAGSEENLVWTFRQKRRFTHKELVRLLRTVLHQRSIRSFDLPAARSFPLELEITWLSRFSADGIRAIRNESRDQQWDGLVKALEIAETERYASGSFRRDWITYESVRDVIDLNPVQAHLASIYPIKGRSSFQRRQVVSAYFRARRFLRLVECWGADEPARILDSLSLGWDVPVFIWFHLLCPAAQRTSALVVRGDLERVWGNTDLV